jgi:hypothetical protein
VKIDYLKNNQILRMRLAELGGKHLYADCNQGTELGEFESRRACQSFLLEARKRSSGRLATDAQS